MNNGSLRIALLISGGGTTMREIIRATKDGRLPHVTPALVIASTRDAGGIEKAKAEGISDDDIIVARPKDFASREAFGDALITLCRDRGVDFLGQYGWLPLTPANVIDEYKGMIVNQHPGPLDPGRPDFGGKGMYGRRVHCARLYYVRKTEDRHPETDVVAHRVTTEFDMGTILHYERVPILKNDDPISLQERALPAEYRVQIETLHMFSDGRVHEISRSPLVPDEHVPTLNEAKRIAITLFPNG